ncbi:MAG: type I-E CRISPR-associated protein Cse2/CasB [Polyangiales bacterium]
MNDTASAPPNDVARGRWQTYADVVFELARAIGRMSPGARADLRRHGDAMTEPFWVLCHDVLERHDLLLDVEAERRWAVVIQMVAHLNEFHAAGLRTGIALRAVLSPARFLKLTRARGATLRAELRSVTHLLSSKAQRIDLTGLAALVLTEGTDAEDDARLRLARDFYRSDDA